MEGWLWMGATTTTTLLICSSYIYYCNLDFISESIMILQEINKRRKDDDDETRKQQDEQEGFGDHKNKRNNDSRKGAELDTSVVHLGQTFYPYSSPQVVVGRCLGDQGDDDDDLKGNVVVALKKRKEMSFDIQSDIINMTTKDPETCSHNKNKDDIDPKMKCKTNKKCLLTPEQDRPLINRGVHQHEEGVVNNIIKQEGGGLDDISTNGKTSKKVKVKKVRGTEILEGSRCSRVNGRGWRCWQPTLVGYSLCEHHLGKGRQRSTSTTSCSSSKRVRSTNNNNQIAAIAPTQSSSRLIIPGEEEKGTEISNPSRDDDHHQEGEMNTSHHHHVVKARSISSLLGQTTNNTVDNRVVTSSSS
ncbi:OLC1v1038226C1 [Oldenlandia corymbosa var. corymbosa]|uniref:OLC1v1038226C1 n=1 Tax=Oldenlandia corymbosa var. corymbosa TaxID=529605 RepID=A0AAV1D098_OLDCO|nr:OLC1v1038226C1 [Oldenlandia corymbosa var. corymbosa]